MTQLRRTCTSSSACLPPAPRLRWPILTISFQCLSRLRKPISPGSRRVTRKHPASAWSPSRSTDARSIIDGGDPPVTVAQLRRQLAEGTQLNVAVAQGEEASVIGWEHYHHCRLRSQVGGRDPVRGSSPYRLTPTIPQTDPLAVIPPAGVCEGRCRQLLPGVQVERGAVDAAAYGEPERCG